VTTGNFKLNITSVTAVTMQVIITDMQGRTVSRQSIPVIAGFSSIPMNAGNLAAGTYTIQAITGGEKSRIIRFVKQ
ncbi:MAG: T9SS type A sorting domain-containing protein, partial [Ferruginibacter sp.]